MTLQPSSAQWNSEYEIQEIREYYQKREQQWQKWKTVKNGLPMSRDPTSVRLVGLPRAPPAQPLLRVRDSQSTPQTDREEVTDLMGADPQSSTNVRIRTAQSERPARQVTYGDHRFADPCQSMRTEVCTNIPQMDVRPPAAVATKL